MRIRLAVVAVALLALLAGPAWGQGRVIPKLGQTAGGPPS